MFRSLSEDEQSSLLASLSQTERAALAYKWAGWIARPNQVAPDGLWRIWLVMAGRGFGKTRIGAEWTRESVRDFEYVNLIGATADDARDIMIEGESGILSICPSWERPEYRPSKRRLDWPNGAKSLIFTADEPERLRGKQHERVWADEIAAWQYPEAWDQMVFGLRLGIDPRAVATTTPKPTRLVRELVRNPHCVVTRGSTYDNLDNLAAAFADELIRKYEGTRLGRQELAGELLEDEGLAYPFREDTHTVSRLDPSATWERFESMDYGSRNPTAWLAWATDYDGNLVVYDEFYEPGLPSVVAPQITERRARLWTPEGGAEPVCYADPSLWIGKGVTNKWGREANSADEFRDVGLNLNRANNDRRAGYLRLAELLKIDENRAFPAWHPRAGEFGAPRMYVVSDRCPQLVEQLREAPMEDEDERFPGEAVSEKWESAYGHAHAAARYGALSKPEASEQPKLVPDDPRQARVMEMVERDRAEDDDDLEYEPLVSDTVPI